MADRIVESADKNVPEIPEILEKVLLYSLKEAKKKLEQKIELVPFTALVVKENLFVENHPGNSAEECFNFARHTVEHARGADAYILCYDGYIEVDDDTKDALIAEGGTPGTKIGIAVGHLYSTDKEGNISFEAEPVYIGEAPNFMDQLKNAEDYDDAEIEEKYIDKEADVNQEEDLS